MAPLRDTRRERFCQLLVEGQSASAAYVSAGFKPSGPNAGRLRNKPEVAARIAELQAEASANHEITVASICKELDEAVAVARAKGQPNAMVSAAGLRAKLGGLGVERQSIEITNNSDVFDDCKSYEQVARTWADGSIDGLTNARWRLVTEGDREYLASIFLEFVTRSQEFLRSIDARPHYDGNNSIITISASPK